MYVDSMPACYFPSTVAFIDDHKDFLLHFTLNFSTSLKTKLFFSATNALSAFKHESRKNNDVSQRFMNEIHQQILHLNISALHREVYNPNRFNEISVVVVDYAMPDMNGLEFCERIQHHPVKKILLTGQANEEIAIQAFNKGIIDRYIPKHINNLASVVEQTIKQLQFEYFKDMSDFVVKYLSTHAVSCLQDEKFQAFFQDVCSKQRIIEYYLLELSGSFLLLDENANVSCLLVKSDSELDRYCQIAKSKHLSLDVIDSVIKRQKIPYFWQASECENTGWNDWSCYVCPAEKMVGNTVYYTALIKDSSAFDIQHKRILSYKNYLRG